MAYGCKLCKFWGPRRCYIHGTTSRPTARQYLSRPRFALSGRRRVTPRLQASKRGLIFSRGTGVRFGSGRRF